MAAKERRRIAETHFSFYFTRCILCVYGLVREDQARRLAKLGRGRFSDTHSTPFSKIAFLNTDPFFIADKNIYLVGHRYQDLSQ